MRKDIPNYEGLYQIDIYGNVYSLPKQGAWSEVRIMKPTIKKSGYIDINLMKNSVAKSFRVHRLVAITFIPNPKNKKQVNHKDGNKANNHVDNLEWNTSGENQRHAYKNGFRNQIGSNNGCSKLTEEDVVKIRLDTRFQTVIAAEYGISQSIVSSIKLRQTWKHVV